MKPAHRGEEEEEYAVRSTYFPAECVDEECSRTKLLPVPVRSTEYLTPLT